MKQFIIVVTLFFLFSNCNNSNNNNVTELDFNEKKIEQRHAQSDTIKKLRVAVSAIITPRETLNYYQDLLNYMTKKLNYEIEFKQRKTYEEVNIMLEKNEVDIAFICSGAYVLEKDKNNVELLAVPITNKLPFYQAYIIVHESVVAESFKDLKGKTFSYTDPLSNTGKLYAEKRIKELGIESGHFFKHTMYSNAHDNSIQLVSKKIVDGATVDGLIYEYIALNYPEKVKSIRILEKSEYFGIPPIVVPVNLDANTKRKIQEFFLTIHNDSVGKKLLNKIMVEKFVKGDDKNYNSIRQNYTYIK